MGGSMEGQLGIFIYDKHAEITLYRTAYLTPKNMKNAKADHGKMLSTIAFTNLLIYRERVQRENHLLIFIMSLFGRNGCLSNVAHS